MIIGMARILVVEDSNEIRYLFVEALTDAGYDIVEAADGDVAAALLKDQHHFDALITDVNIPGAINGLGVGQQFRALFPDHPILYVSGTPNPLPATSPPTHKDVVLNKPCTLGKLVSSVNALFVA